MLEIIDNVAFTGVLSTEEDPFLKQLDIKKSAFVFFYYDLHNDL